MWTGGTLVNQPSISPAQAIWPSCEASAGAPLLTGWIVQVTGGFHLAFVLAATIALAGAGFLVLGVKRIEQVAFAPKPI